MVDYLKLKMMIMKPSWVNYQTFEIEYNMIKLSYMDGLSMKLNILYPLNCKGKYVIDEDWNEIKFYQTKNILMSLLCC